MNDRAAHATIARLRDLGNRPGPFFEWKDREAIREAADLLEQQASRETVLREEIERLKAFLEQANLSASRAEHVADYARDQLVALRARVGDEIARAFEQGHWSWPTTDEPTRAERRERYVQERLAALSAAPDAQGQDKEKEDLARVDGFPDGEHGDLPRPATE